jgi:hypothetical protein
MKRRESTTEPRIDRPRLAARLRTIRIELFGEHGVSALAQQLGLPEGVWCSYESGATVPAEILLAFLEKTGANPDWLLNGQGAGARYLRSPEDGVVQRSAAGVVPGSAAKETPARIQDDVTDQPTELMTGLTGGWATEADTKIMPAEGPPQPNATMTRPSPEPAWQSERWGYIMEINRLQQRLAQAVERNPEIDATIAVLEDENRCLRKLCEELRYTPGAKAVSARWEIASLRGQLDAARSELLFRQDENHLLHRSLDQVGHAGECHSAARTEEVPPAGAGLDLRNDNGPGLPAGIDPIGESMRADLAGDERMGALRRDLQELHFDEIEIREKCPRAVAWLSGHLRRWFGPLASSFRPGQARERAEAAR